MNELKIKVSTKVAIKNIKLGCRVLGKAIMTNDVKAMEVGLVAISNGVAVFQIVEQQEKKRRLLNDNNDLDAVLNDLSNKSIDEILDELEVNKGQ